MLPADIKDFNQQFVYQPEIKNAGRLKKFKKFVVVGVGGSNLAAGLIKIAEPNSDIIIHRDYGLPAASDLKERLIICSSYSGNTEEVINALDLAIKKKLAVAVIATGGKLLKKAKAKRVPYIILPNVDMQPRSAIGYATLALLVAMHGDKSVRAVQRLAGVVDADDYIALGKDLAQKLRKVVPLIYASAKNESLAYNLKVRLNETSKIPTFINVFPELNHNEMIGFNGGTVGKKLNDNFHCVFLVDPSDGARMLKRMAATKRFYKKMGLPVTTISLAGQDAWRKIFNTIILADWVAYYLAEYYKVDPGPVPLVEKFKKQIADK
ncbi:MAG: SIS domain-containing protein [bacterium]|nr:SIS domain-containing protein [bacterium]